MWGVGDETITSFLCKFVGSFGCFVFGVIVADADVGESPDFVIEVGNYFVFELLIATEDFRFEGYCDHINFQF